MVTDSAQVADHVDGILEQWGRERPDVDASPMGIIGRVHRLADILHAHLRPVFADAGLLPGDFDVLASLRRSGEPFELTPGQLGASTMITSGAVTKRVDRLAAQGLLQRSPDPAGDGRSKPVRLTEAGHQLVDRLLPHHVANERRLLASLSEVEQATLTSLLRTWSISLQGLEATPPHRSG